METCTNTKQQVHQPHLNMCTKASCSYQTMKSIMLMANITHVKIYLTNKILNLKFTDSGHLPRLLDTVKNIEH
jgi:hypothetical protein